MKKWFFYEMTTIGTIAITEDTARKKVLEFLNENNFQPEEVKIVREYWNPEPGIIGPNGAFVVAIYYLAEEDLSASAKLFRKLSAGR